MFNILRELKERRSKIRDVREPKTPYVGEEERILGVLRSVDAQRTWTLLEQLEDELEQHEEEEEHIIRLKEKQSRTPEDDFAIRLYIREHAKLTALYDVVEIFFDTALHEAFPDMYFEGRRIEIRNGWRIVEILDRKKSSSIKRKN